MELKFKTKYTETYMDDIGRILKIHLSSKTLKTIRERIKMLQWSPYMYPKIDTYITNMQNLRKMTVNNYIILYEVNEKEKKVYILHIYNGRENYLL